MTFCRDTCINLHIAVNYEFAPFRGKVNVFQRTLVFQSTFLLAIAETHLHLHKLVVRPQFFHIIRWPREGVGRL